MLTGCDNLNLFKADVSNVKENEICYVKQSINYEDSNEIIYNPDMRFYSAVDLQVLYDGVDNLTSKCKEIKKQLLNILVHILLVQNLIYFILSLI